MIEFRSEIDRIDRELQRLLEERMAVSAKIGEYKAGRGLPVYDPEREEQKIASLRASASTPENGEAAERVMRVILEVSRDLQKRMRPDGT